MTLSGSNCSGDLVIINLVEYVIPDTTVAHNSRSPASVVNVGIVSNARSLNVSRCNESR